MRVCSLKPTGVSVIVFALQDGCLLTQGSCLCPSFLPPPSLFLVPSHAFRYRLFIQLYVFISSTCLNTALAVLSPGVALVAMQDIG